MNSFFLLYSLFYSNQIGSIFLYKRKEVPTRTPFPSYHYRQLRNFYCITNFINFLILSLYSTNKRSPPIRSDPHQLSARSKMHYNVFFVVISKTIIKHLNQYIFMWPDVLKQNRYGRPYSRGAI